VVTTRMKKKKKERGIPECFRGEKKKKNEEISNKREKGEIFGRWEEKKKKKKIYRPFVWAKKRFDDIRGGGRELSICEKVRPAIEKKGKRSSMKAVFDCKGEGIKKGEWPERKAFAGKKKKPTPKKKKGGKF